MAFRLGTARVTVPTEAAWLDQIIGTTPGREGVAVRFGWESVHFRSARTAYGWRTPVQGSMGKGWPDLVLVRPPRIIFAECKVTTKLRPEQQAVLDLLRDCGAEVYVWRPEDFDEVARLLR